MMESNTLKAREIIVKNAEGDADAKAMIIHEAKLNYSPKVSIIIPVYNTEEYLCECLDSVVNQTLKDIEIICIDDGSTDNSLSILMKYAEADYRLTIITQENQGVSVARNAGIAQVSGEYFQFVDSDDWLDLECLLKVYEDACFSKADITIFGMKTIIEKDIENCIFITDLFFKADISRLNNILPYMVYSCDKLFKSSFIKNSSILFFKGIKTSEDGLFCLCCYFNKANFGYVKEYYYNYRKNINSRTQLSNNNNIKTDIEGYNRLLETTLYREQNLFNKLAVVNKYCEGCLYYWNIQKMDEYSNRDKYEISIFLNNIESSFKLCNLNTLERYIQLKHQVFGINQTLGESLCTIILRVIFYGFMKVQERLTYLLKSF